MPKYAVKIGEINLVGEQPLTPNERRQALVDLRRNLEKVVHDYGNMRIELEPAKV